MQLSRLRKVALGLVGTVLLGALGSGLWELGLRPGGQWLAKAFLTAVTLGSSYLKDRVYIEAARGYHEAGANEAFELLILFAFWTFGAGSMLLDHQLRRAHREAERAASIFDANRAEPEREETRIAEVLSEIDSSLRSMRRWIRQGRILFWAFIVVSSLFVGTRVTRLVELREADDARAYFPQSLTICRPFMDARSAQLVESRFASLRGRGDYIAVTDSLKHVAATNGLQLPEFSPW